MVSFIGLSKFRIYNRPNTTNNISHTQTLPLPYPSSLETSNHEQGAMTHDQWNKNNEPSLEVTKNKLYLAIKKIHWGNSFISQFKVMVQSSAS